MHVQGLALSVSSARELEIWLTSAHSYRRCIFVRFENNVDGSDCVRLECKFSRSLATELNCALRLIVLIVLVVVTRAFARCFFSVSLYAGLARLCVPFLHAVHRKRYLTIICLS